MSFPKLTTQFLLVSLCCMLATSAQAVLTLHIVKGNEGAQPIAIVPFGWRDLTRAAPAKLGEVIASDLGQTGRFSPLMPQDLPSQPHTAAEVNFSDWRILGVSNLVIGDISPTGDGRYSVEFRLFDVFRAKQLTGYQLVVTAEELRRTGHQIADILYQQLTGERGAFDTRVAYITERRAGTGEREYVLNVADSDGQNARAILRSKAPLLSPAWSPDGQSLAYVSFENGSPRIFIQNLADGNREMVAGFPGINGAPAFSPDGKSLAITLSKDGNSELYILDIASRRLRRLTASSGIDTEAAWSPDGSFILFTSDRGGQPQIYRIPVFGGKAARVTFEGKYNARPRISPDGTKIAMVHVVDGQFRIALLDLTTNALTVLTDSNLDESPTFAPNGNTIMYGTTVARGGTLAAVSVDGRIHQRIDVDDGNLREPAWSPFRTP